MTQVHPDILLAVQLGALRARSYWPQRVERKKKLAAEELWGVIMWSGKSEILLEMRDSTRGQEVGFISSRNKFDVTQE